MVMPRPFRDMEEPAGTELDSPDGSPTPGTN